MTICPHCGEPTVDDICENPACAAYGNAEEDVPELQFMHEFEYDAEAD